MGGSIGLDEVILDGLTSSVAIKDSGGDELAIAVDGSIAITDNGGSLTVDAVDFDIRDLVHTADSVNLGDGTVTWDLQTIDSAFDAAGVMPGVAGVRRDADTSPVDTDGDAHPFVFNATGFLKTTAALSSAVDDDEAHTENGISIAGRGVSGLLSALSDTNDKFDLLSDLYRRVWVNNAYNVEIKMTTETIGATQSEIVSTPMPGRKSMTLQNASNNSVWLGHNSGVTADDAATGGLEIKKNVNYSDDFGENINVHLISDGAGRVVKVLEKG